MEEPITIRYEVEEKDDKAVFYSRTFGDSRVVIIPKKLFTLDETESTFVSTLKNELDKENV